MRSEWYEMVQAIIRPSSLNTVKDLLVAKGGIWPLLRLQSHGRERQRVVTAAEPVWMVSQRGTDSIKACNVPT